MSSAQDKTEHHRNVKAVWIWDPDRLRVVWANTPGLEFWGEETLFDLLEKDFAPSDPAAAAFARHISGPQDAAQDAAPTSERLVLTPRGAAQRVDCRFNPHRLPDGRMGLRIEATPVATGAEAEIDRLREMISSAPFAVSLFGEDGGLLTQNGAAEQIFGANSEFDLARRYGDIARTRAALKAVLVNGACSEAVDIATRIGRRRHRVNMRRIQDPVTGDLAILAVFTDISDRAAAEAALSAARESERKSEGAAALIENLDAGIAIFNDQFGLLFANPAALAMLEMTAGSADTLIDKLPRDAARLHSAARAVRSGARASARLDLPLAREDGSVRWFSVAVRKATWRDAEALLVSLSDVTGERRALMRAKLEEEERSRALEALGVGSLFIDDTGTIRQVSGHAALVFDADHESLIGSSLAKWLDVISAKKLSDYLKNGPVVAGRDFENGVPAALRGAAGAEAKRLFIAVRPPSRGGGGLRGVAVRPLDRDGDRREEPPVDPAGLARSEALAQASHEMRNPLNAIIGFTEIMLADPDSVANPRYREYLDDIHDSGRYMSRIVDDLLDMRRIEAGALNLKFEVVDLIDLVERIVRQAQPDARRREVRLTAQPAVATARVLADEQTLRQSLTNLTVNALKYVGANGAVTATVGLSEDGGLAIEIIDDGPGMTPDELEQALRPFGQPSSRNPAEKGAGLGLPLARGFAEANRASFVMQSVKGVGTTVRIAFSPGRCVAD